MPFCPKCKEKFEAGITECSSCEETLVQSLAADKKITYRAFEPIYLVTVTNQIESVMIMGILSDEGIPSFVKEKGSGNYLSLYMGYSFYGEDIYVDEADYEKASLLVKEFYNSNEETEKIDIEDVPMPFYKSPRFAAAVIMIAITVAALISLVIGIIYLI